MFTREDLIALAKTQIGVPWVHRGRSWGQGLDCAGLIVETLKKLGESVQDVLGYGTEPLGCYLTIIMDDNLVCRQENPKISDLMLGDIILLWYANRTKPSHMGFVSYNRLNEVSIVHSFAQPGRVVEQPIEGFWDKRLVKVYQPKGLVQ